MPKIYFVDIDETICFYENSRDYHLAKPHKDKIKKINDLYERGNHIVYWTSRGGTTGINWYDLTKKQLMEWGAKYNELRCDKPHYDVFIDDKSIQSVDNL